MLSKPEPPPTKAERINKIVVELSKLDGDLESNLQGLLKLRKEKPFMYSMAVLKLKSM